MSTLGIVQTELNQLLLNDLHESTGRDISGLLISWDDATGEGGGTCYKEEYIENLSDVVVKDESGQELFFGWTESFIDSSGKLRAYWSLLYDASSKKKLSEGDFSLPERVWRQLSEKDKIHLAETRQGWSSDKNLMSYRIRVIPELIEKGIVNYKKIDINALRQLNSGVDIDLLAKNMEQYIQIKKKILNYEETHPDEIIDSTFEAYLAINSLKEADKNSYKKLNDFYNIILDFSLLIRHAEVVFRVAKAKDY